LGEKTGALVVRGFDRHGYNDIGQGLPLCTFLLERRLVASAMGGGRFAQKSVATDCLDGLTRKKKKKKNPQSILRLPRSANRFKGAKSTDPPGT